MAKMGICSICGKEKPCHIVYFETDGTCIADDKIGDMYCAKCLYEEEQLHSQMNGGKATTGANSINASVENYTDKTGGN